MEGSGEVTTAQIIMAYTEEETSLRNSLRHALSERCSAREIVNLYDGDQSAEFAAWEVMRDLGLVGLLIDERHGGASGGLTDAGVVLEELGYAAAPAPFLASSVVAANILATVGHGESLQRLADGEIAVLLLPVDEMELDEDLPIRLDADSLSGSVTTVLGAAQADMFLVPVRSPSGASLHLVESRARGVTVHRIPALDMTRALADVNLSGAAGKCLSPDCGAAIDRALTLGAALAASDQLGGAQWCIDQLLDYLCSRRQFGRLIGSFQAVKHRMADLWVEVELMRTAARNAAVAGVGAEDEFATAAALAQSFSSDAAVHIAEETIQLHAGIAMTWEHPAHLYLKRAKASQVAFGRPGKHRKILGDLIDVPSVW